MTTLEINPPDAEGGCCQETISEPVKVLNGYTWVHRTIDSTALIIAAVLIGLIVSRSSLSSPLPVFAAAVGMILGLIAADFSSGVVHWAFDTWGDVDTPIIGQFAIRTFREHHHDPESITRHDFVEVNGSNALLSLIPLALALFSERKWCGTFGRNIIDYFALSLAIFVILTSQIHKWAHASTRPSIVTWLQDKKLILHPEHHARHHQLPYLRAYCITSGWLNGPLDRINFFRWVERIVTRLTGVPPRSNECANTALNRAASLKSVKQ